MVALMVKESFEKMFTCRFSFPIGNLSHYRIEFTSSASFKIVVFNEKFTTSHDNLETVLKVQS